MDSISELADAGKKRPKVSGYDEYFTKSEEMANADRPIQRAKDNEASGRINSLSNLKDTPIFINMGR